MDGHLLLNSASCPVHYCHNESSLLGKWSALSCTDHACRKISSSSSFIIKQKVCCHSQFVSDNPGGGADHAYQVFARRCDRFPQGQSKRRVSVDMLRPPSPSTSCSHQRDLWFTKAGAFEQTSNLVSKTSGFAATNGLLEQPLSPTPYPRVSNDPFGFDEYLLIWVRLHKILSWVLLFF